ncbi:unnamed protein product [Rotaria sordida]|uniref:Uncharacterized protein n=1 Tax=Rotaria sordida TaxID=392033 RepID=A0A815A5N1_9BILA|nr:unnamed protein product [Rotaria sordida]
MILSTLLILFVNQCLSQTGFPKQFQATLNISGLRSWDSPFLGVKQLLYDYKNLRARFDLKGSRAQQNETWILKYKPEGAEPDTPALQGYTMFNINPDFPYFTKNNCWYRTGSMVDIGPFPVKWLHGVEGTIEIYPWLPLPPNLINKGEEWIPEVQLNATRYDSPEICNLIHSRIGKVPCLSYFETKNRPVKTIQARPSPPESFDSDEYLTTVYLSFTNGIPSQAEHLFDLPKQWPSYCGNANAEFTLEPSQAYVVTPHDHDHFTIKLQTPPVHAPSDQVKVEFKVQPSGIYNGTRCTKFNTLYFDKENWQVPQQVDMPFVDYGCCIYKINASGGGYDWQYVGSSFFVFGSPCEHSTNLCREPNHRCVHHPRCHNLPVCYPVPRFNKQLCPPIATPNTSTTTSMPTTTTTPRTTQQLGKHYINTS